MGRKRLEKKENGKDVFFCYVLIKKKKENGDQSK